MRHAVSYRDASVQPLLQTSSMAYLHAVWHRPPETERSVHSHNERTKQLTDQRKSIYHHQPVNSRLHSRNRIYVGDSIVRKTDTRLSKEEDVVVCLPGARIEHVRERVEKIMGRGNGGSILVHIGTNNAAKEGTTAIVEKYRNLLKKTKQARIRIRIRMFIYLTHIQYTLSQYWHDY